MIRVDYEQGTQTWLQWRTGGIGGSDAPVIMGVSPWQTREELLRYKATHRADLKPKKISSSKSGAQRRGTLMEPEAREAYMEMTGNYVTPACCIHGVYDFLRASCDGMTEDNHLVLEIKCVNWMDHMSATEGLVPQKYWPQVQHLLLVTECPKGLDYFSFSKSTRFPDNMKRALVQVKPEETYLKDLLAEEIKFWEELQELRGRKSTKIVT